MLNIRLVSLLVVASDKNSSSGSSGVAMCICNSGSIADVDLADGDVCVVHFSLLVWVLCRVLIVVERCI